MRIWTVDEANAALPHVRTVVERARVAAADARAHSVPSGNGHSAGRAKARARLEQAVAELEADGIVLRDPVQGLIDFTAEAPSGRRYWLCWLAGEDDVGWWHWPEDGFAGRRPLSDPPA